MPRSLMFPGRRSSVRTLFVGDKTIEPDFREDTGGGLIGYCHAGCLQADLVGPDKHLIRCAIMGRYVSNRVYAVCEPWVRYVLLGEGEEKDASAEKV